MTARILLSGFEPFDGAPINESWEVVQRAASELEGADGSWASSESRETASPEPLVVETVCLPVEFERAGRLLLAEVERHDPVIVIAVGLAAGRSALTPERVAINVRDARIPDNAGATPIDEPCVPGGPVGYWSTLPIKAMVQAVRTQLELPAQLSHTAGTYVCNDVFYLLQHSMHAATSSSQPGSPARRSGFVHVPSASELPVDDCARALALMVRTAVSCDTDAALAMGTEF